eukprot:gnl/TRDRNA2_/TRDRNA2_81817_c0_seq2.p3 gnl/TRDRNA2_/TRDRNA2_81817_c0~~gnl/TRDRNA2_/TRDRNA2_81817_c0_seq2.p3  ORF type:complete len:131 (+),score=26.19 gnl/TRDRNA2_/TRDRNA2_81817_c0_seq2:402-794(+)
MRLFPMKYVLALRRHWMQSSTRVTDAECAGRDEAVGDLAKVYRNILAEFAASDLPRLRLLPVSGGIFSGKFAPQLPAMTAEAIGLGFSRLEHAAKVQVLKASSLELCIFMESDFDAFSKAFDEAVKESRL